MPDLITRTARSSGLVAGLLLLASLPLAGCDGDGGDDSQSPSAGSGGSGAASGAAGRGGSGSASGAGGSMSGGAGAGGSPGAAALAACQAFCAAEEDCDPDTTLAECEEVECVNPVNPSQPLADSPPDCQEALGAWWTCLAMASDPCDRDVCPTDFVASACF